MSQFVQWGIMCCWEWIVFKVKLFYISIYSEISLIWLFFSIILERIALLYYFRWLVESLISYFDIFHSWNIYVNGFQQAWKWFQECFSYKSKVCTQNILGTFLTFSEVGILTFRICWNLFIILKNFNASFSQKWFRVIWGGKIPIVPWF